MAVRSILVIMIVFSTLGVYAKDGKSCKAFFSESRIWRPASGDLFNALRSNPAHYWSWLKGHSTSSLFSATGIVVGDPHLYNFGAIVTHKGEVRVGVVDIDDGGFRGSLLGDFLRYFTANQLSEYTVGKKDLWKAYVKGLNGKDVKKPSYLKKLDKLDRKDVLKIQQEYIDAITKKDRFTKESGLSSMDEAPPLIRELYKNAETDIMSEMNGYKILDIGFRVKENGGSQSLPRFWFLISRDDVRHIWEFKMERTAAIAQYSSQSKDPNARLSGIIKVYRPKNVLGPYRMIETGGYVFLLRERFDSLVGGIVKDLDKKEGEELSLYFANQMGIWQSQQNSKTLVEQINKDPDSALSEIKQLSEQYIEILESQHDSV